MPITIEENKSLKQLNTFGIDVNARYFATVRTVLELQSLLAEFESPLILGGGSNILFTKNVAGLVIHNCISGIEKIDENNDHVFLKIGAGENWHQLVLYCIENNYAGIENLSLIPGTVGAAPIQNIGAYGVELKDVLESVQVISTEPKEARLPSTAKLWLNKDCHFSYRNSIFKHELKNKVVITYITLKLNKHPVFNINYGTLKEKLKNKPLSIKSISDAIISIRQEKLPDPNIIGNAGSFFKNPVVTRKRFLSLQQKHPKMPHFTEENAMIKIPAAWLIEQCGYKGKRFGDVGVHANQALVLVNYGHGTGREIKQLSEKIQEAVFDTFGIRLITEVNII